MQDRIRALASSATLEYAKMTAPLVIRLEATLQSTGDLAQRAILSAQIACYQARIGEFAQAEQRRLELRRDFGDGRNAQVSILIMCVEALLLYFKDLDQSSRDRLVRAQLLSVACRQPALTALTSAWLAHIDFNLGRFESMAASVDSCFDAIESDDGSAMCRIALVLGDAFTFVGQDDNARHWYERARLTANRIGDQAALGALTYNRAALHVSVARIRQLTAMLGSADIALISAEVRSAVNYQSVAELKSLDHLLRSASIGVMMLERRFELASAAIKEVLESGSVPQGSSELALLYADRATCLARMGQAELASEVTTKVAELLLEQLDPDDRALLLGALGEVSEASGDPSSALSYRQAQAVALNEHRELTQKLAAQLQPYASGTSIKA